VPGFSPGLLRRHLVSKYMVSPMWRRGRGGSYPPPPRTDPGVRLSFHYSRITVPQQDSRPSLGISPSVSVGYHSSTLSPLVNYDCDEGCGVPFVLHLYYHESAWKSMGLGTTSESAADHSVRGRWHGRCRRRSRPG
jgi:hypothetical protein